MAADFLSGLVQGLAGAQQRASQNFLNDEIKKAQIKAFKHDLEQKEKADKALAEVQKFFAPQPTIERTTFGEGGPQVAPPQKRGLTDLLADPEMTMNLLQSGKAKDVISLQQLQSQQGQQDFIRNLISGQPGAQPGQSGAQPGGLEFTGLKVGPRGEMMPDFARAKFKTEVPAPDGMSMIQLDEFGREMGRRPMSPAEIKKTEVISPLEKKKGAKKNVSNAVSDAVGLYHELNEIGAVVNVENTTMENIMASISASGPGQFVGRKIGTQAQSIRNKINQLRPTLINYIRQASEMGARGLDSEKELEFYMQAATDPQKDIQSNLAALKVLDDAYGLGISVGDIDVKATKALRDEFSELQKGKPSLKGPGKKNRVVDFNDLP